MGQSSSSSKPGTTDNAATTTTTTTTATTATTATIATQTQTTPDSNSTTSMRMMTPVDEDDLKIDMMEDFIEQYTRDAPSQVPTDVQRQASDDTPLQVPTDVERQASDDTPSQVPTAAEQETSDTSVPSPPPVQRQESAIVIPTAVYEQQASAHSADGTEKIVVSVDALVSSDPSVNQLHGEMIDSRELVSELQKSVEALRESMKNGAQVGGCQQTVVNNIESTMAQLKMKFDGMEQRLAAVEKRLGTKH